MQYRLSTLACYSPADGADHAEEYSKAVLFRRERQLGMVIAVLCFVVCLRNLGDLRETLGVALPIDRVLLREYSLADSADNADECSKLHYFAEKD